MNNPYEWLRGFIEGVPDLLQPLIVAIAAAIPYVEGEGAAAFGIIAGVNPIIAAIAGATGNILCVIAVVLLGSRVRESVVARRARKAGTVRAEVSLVHQGSGNIAVMSDGGAPVASPADAVSDFERPTDDPSLKQTGREKGRARIRRWVVRFGVPGASIIAPLALPTMLTAAFFVGTGVPKGWVILWQAIAIVLWTSAVALAATGVLALLGW